MNEFERFRPQFKAMAKQQIKGKIGILFLITLIIAVLSAAAGAVFSFIPVVGKLAAVIIVTPAFALSMTRVYLGVAAGYYPEAKDAFCGFDDFWSAFKVQFLVGLFTFLWSLLFVIPGIVKGYAYSMSMYILAENKGKPARECIAESQEMTYGYKWDLWVMLWSFFGWELLCTVTFGIAGIWVGPYMQATWVNAYHWLKGKYSKYQERERIVQMGPEL